MDPTPEARVDSEGGPTKGDIQYAQNNHDRMLEQARGQWC